MRCFASSKGIQTIQGNAFDAIAKPESVSLLYPWLSFLEVTPKNSLSIFVWQGLSDNQEDGVVVMRTYIWIGLAMVPGGLVLWLWWYQHRRAWSTRKQDETMRRHVNRNYD